MSNGIIFKPGVRAAIDTRMMGRYRREAAMLRCAMAAFKVLGLPLASALGGALGRLVGPRTGRSRSADRNLRRVFPDMEAAERARVIAAMWANLGRVVAEYAHLDKFQTNKPGGRLELVGNEHIEKALSENRSILFVSGHFANWELMPRTAWQAYGLELAEVYRAPNNPFVHDWILALRRRVAAPVQVPKGSDGARMLISHISGGGHVAMLVDQKLNEGIAAPFLGHEAMTSPAAAQLALKYDCAVLPAFMERTGGARFRLSVHPALDLPQSGNRQADIAAVTTRLNDILGGWIRQKPENWLWIHNRWPPAGQPDRPDGTA